MRQRVSWFRAWVLGQRTRVEFWLRHLHGSAVKLCGPLWPLKLCGLERETIMQTVPPL